MISPNTNEDFDMNIDMAIDTVPPLFENVLDENVSCEMCKDNRFQTKLLENKLEISEQKNTRITGTKSKFRKTKLSLSSSPIYC